MCSGQVCLGNKTSSFLIHNLLELVHLYVLLLALESLFYLIIVKVNIEHTSNSPFNTYNPFQILSAECVSQTCL